MTFFSLLFISYTYLFIYPAFFVISIFHCGLCWTDQLILGNQFQSFGCLSWTILQNELIWANPMPIVIEHTTTHIIHSQPNRIQIEKKKHLHIYLTFNKYLMCDSLYLSTNIKYFVVNRFRLSFSVSETWWYRFF